MASLLQRRMLSKEDENAGQEVEVRREDQDKINRFSRLHQRELLLEEELKSKNVGDTTFWWCNGLTDGIAKQKEKEELDDLSTELELADEDEKIHYHRYKIGDAFFHLPLEQAQEMLSTATNRIEEDTGVLEEKISTIKEQMTELKVDLYARFGKQINLEGRPPDNARPWLVRIVVPPRAVNRSGASGSAAGPWAACEGQQPWQRDTQHVSQAAVFSTAKNHLHKATLSHLSHSLAAYKEKDAFNISEFIPAAVTAMTQPARTSGSEMNRAAEQEQLDSPLPDDDEIEDDDLAALDQIRSRTRSRPGYETIEWKVDDPENPQNWSKPKKNVVVALTSTLVLNSTIGSALPSQAIPFIADSFGVTSDTQRVLPISVFLVGYVFGPLIWGPLSEHVGRRSLTLVTFTSFTLFTMGCALAPTWDALLVLRFFTGVFAASPIAIVAGILADVYGDARERGRAFGIFMVVTTLGPLIAPIISGYTADKLNWRWAFWVNLMFAGATLAFVFFLPETYEPVLLERRAKKLRRQDPANNKVVAPRELEETDVRQLLSVVLARPLRMLFTEPIVACCCAYLGLVYAVFYMSFQAYPLIYQGVYGLSPGETGLTYLSVGVGAAIALPIFWNWDAVLDRARARGAAWVQREEYRRLPLACVGGPLFVISLFWMGWTARPSVHFVVPLLAGVPFGVGMVLIFFAILNYLVDAYEIFAASANAASSTSRSVLAVVLPLASSRMFARLGIAGACSLLAGLLTLMCLIPFIFIWKGESIRARSKFCVALRQRREKLARREDRRRRDQARERREKAREETQPQQATVHQDV
ncbi:hypothetical protein PWT90_08582 [Aphanocladium album]|nr:hypothetical protein PWT90_08582 [Aphanocladium album]